MNVSQRPIELHRSRPVRIQLAPNNLLFVIDVCAKVRAILSECTCCDQFPMIRVAEGKYRIGETQTLVFLRVSTVTLGILL